MQAGHHERAKEEEPCCLDWLHHSLRKNCDYTRLGVSLPRLPTISESPGVIVRASKQSPVYITVVILQPICLVDGGSIELDPFPLHINRISMPLGKVREKLEEDRAYALWRVLTNIFLSLPLNPIREVGIGGGEPTL